MIEILLQAERSLTVGQLDIAERLYWQAIEADPRNSIAVVGLARVALERGDDRTAYGFGRKALEIDADNAAAQRLVTRLREVMEHRGEAVPTQSVATTRRPDAAAASVPGPSATGASTTPPSATAPRKTAPPKTAPAPQTRNASGAEPKKRRGLIGRILGR